MQVQLSRMELTLEDIRDETGYSMPLVREYAGQAQEKFPGLPWETRGPKQPNLMRYVKMNDGKPGESRLTEGSVVRSAALKKRNR